MVFSFVRIQSIDSTAKTTTKLAVMALTWIVFCLNVVDHTSLLFMLENVTNTTLPFF